LTSINGRGSAQNGTKTVTTITIDRAISGRGDVAFGGYVAGLLGAQLKSSGKVNFQRAVSLELPSRIERLASGTALYKDDVFLANPEPMTLELGIPVMPTVRETQTASVRFEAPAAQPDGVLMSRSGKFPA
jgi:hypothetical protein